MRLAGKLTASDRERDILNRKTGRPKKDGVKTLMGDFGWVFFLSSSDLYVYFPFTDNIGLGRRCRRRC